MRIKYQPFEVKLKYPFSISGFTRVATPIMFVNINYEDFSGVGEASMVPYLGENLTTAADFLAKVDLSWVRFPFNYDGILTYLDAITPGNPSIKAAIDIALHDLEGKIKNIPCYQLFSSDPSRMPFTSQTIGIDTTEIILKKVREADACKILKVKLGADNDKEIIETIRSVSNKPLYIDANQGWTDKFLALDQIEWLTDKGALLVEQPMGKQNYKDNGWITERSPIPIIGDEAVQRLQDVEKAVGVYHGINIKLMKSAGMHEGFKMIQKARELNLKVLIGCMSETSVATQAANALAPLCDWADLDGPFLTANNPFKDPLFVDGKYILSNSAGLGVEGTAIFED